MRRLAGAAAALAGAAALFGCGALDPFPTNARDPKPGQPAGQRVGICYNTLTASLAELQQQAQRECAEGTTAEPIDTDWYLITCPLLLPARASFICTAKK
jgi:hypothetical protein